MKRNRVAAKVGVWTVAIVVAILALLYFTSIPRPWYKVREGMEVEIIQAGTIQSVWIDTEEEGGRYVHVLFGDGKSRKCTISTVNLTKSSSVPHATIYEVRYAGSPQQWSFICMDIELDSDDYWRFRWAGWPFWGERFRKNIRIDY